MATDLFFVGAFLYFTYIAIDNPNISPVSLIAIIVIVYAWRKHGVFLAWRKENRTKFYTALYPPETRKKKKPKRPYNRYTAMIDGR